MLLDGLFVEVIGGAFFDGDRILGADAKAVAQPVAEVFGKQAGLAVYDLDSAFSTIGHAKPAAIALIFIDLHNLSRLSSHSLVLQLDPNWVLICKTCT